MEKLGVLRSSSAFASPEVNYSKHSAVGYVGRQAACKIRDF